MSKFFKNSIVIFLVGWIIGDMMPTITDPIHFYLQNYIASVSLTKLNFLLLQAFDWYILDILFPLFLLLLVLIFHIRKMKTIKQISIISAIIGFSLVLTLAWWFLK